MLNLAVNNIWLNRTAPTGIWYKSSACKKWHEKVRLWLVKLILKSLTKNYSWAKNETSSS